MSEPRRSASVIPWLPDGRLLWARRNDDAPALAGFHVGPGGVLEESDVSGPHDGGDRIEYRVAALRELFEEVGVLHVHGEPPPPEELPRLRHRFIEEPARAHEELAARGCRWRTSELEPIGRWVTPEFAPRRFDTEMFALRLDRAHALQPDEAEIAHAEWVQVERAFERWGSGEVLLGPPLAWLIRGLRAHGEVRGSELRAVYGADAEPAQRWDVVPGVQMLPFRTPTLPPATMTNSYIVGSGQAVIVEPATPFDDEIERMLDWVEEARRDGIEPIAILTTHHHSDHVGCADTLRERLGVPLWAHAMTAQRLDGKVRFDRLVEPEERIALDGPEPISLRAVHTPGHAPGHLCFVEERSRVMICGDMVASIGTIIVEPTDGDMVLYLDSLRRMAELEPSMLLPAHGMPVRDPQAKIAHYIQHRLAREAKVRQALTQLAPAAAIDLVPLAYDDAPKAVWPLAALTTEAHLLKLERDGVCHRHGRRWVLN